MAQSSLLNPRAYLPWVALYNHFRAEKKFGIRIVD